jgi:hypothetical protein
MIFSSWPGWTKSTLSECCVLITHQICWNKASTGHHRKLQAMGVRSVILARNKVSVVQLPIFAIKIRFWILAKISRPLAFTCYVWQENTHTDVGISRTYKTTINCPANTSSKTRQNFLQDKPLTHRWSDPDLVLCTRCFGHSRWVVWIYLIHTCNFDLQKGVHWLPMG